MKNREDNNSTKGIVYVLSNPAMPGLIKIGNTKRNDVEKRMKELYGTGVPFPYKCEFSCEVDDCIKVENALHIAFDSNRVNTSREFFTLNPEQPIVILKLLMKSDITTEVKENTEKNISEIDKTASEKFIKKPNRPQMNFAKMDIPIGVNLIFSKDRNIKAEVIGERLVRYNNKEKYLSQITKELLGLEINVQPSLYWEYNGRSLKDIYEEIYQ